MPYRRRPWPFDIVVAGTGLMLARDPRGKPSLVAVKAQPYPDQPAPGDIDQEAAPPVVEVPHAWNDLSLGFGLSIDTADMQSHKYSYALGVDASIAGYIMKGPQISTCTPTTRDTTNGIVDFLDMPNGTLLAMNGRYVLVRASDDPTSGWVSIHDFGAGVNCVNSTVHTSDGGTPATPTIYAAMNGANKAQYCTDAGNTWVQFATFTAIDFFVVSRQLWRISDVNMASNCDAANDPTNEASWANANSYRIGDKSYPVNRVHISAVGYPLYLKQDGVYTLDSSGQDFRLYPWFQFGANPEDGHYAWDFGNDTHVTYGNQHVRLVPTISFGNPHIELQPIGPERIPENTSEVHGRLTAGVGDGTMFAYVGLFNPDTGNSYLMKFSSWVGPGVQSGKLEEAQRVDAWHGSISQPFVNKKITAMIRSRVGAPANHYRCYIGFSDGTISWFTLPCVANPYLCALGGNYAFDTTADGTINFPLFHGGHMADPKSIHGVSVAGIVLNNVAYAQFQYKLSPAITTYSVLTAADNTSAFTTTPGSRIDSANLISSYLIDPQLVLHNTTINVSPIVTTPTIHYSVITPVALRYKGAIQASAVTTKRDGRPMRMGAQTIRNFVKAVANSRAPVSITLPDGSTRRFQMIDYDEQPQWSERDTTISTTIPFEIVEYVPNWSQFSPTQQHGLVYTLFPYNVSDLNDYLISDLAGL